jgi:hypothetical protein
VFSLHRKSLKLILAMNPTPSWFCHKNGFTSKMIFEVEMFFSSQNFDFPFYLKGLLELFFFLLFLFMLLLLRTRGI